MPDFYDINDMLKYIGKDMLKVLGNEVDIEVKQHISDAVPPVIYDAGNPIDYDRRGEGSNYIGTGSIRDPNEMESFIEGNTLIVEDNASPKSMDSWGYNSSLAEVIEFGTTSTDWWNKPRPFISEARDQLEKDKKYVDAMADGLTKLGYIVTK